MHHSRRKSFDWYGLKQHFSIRKYHFGAASVLLGMSIALGTGTQVVQAAETVTTPESTSVASSTSATESTTSETSTETATSSSSERTVEIGYIVKYATEDGTLVNASVETVSVTTTETIAKATVSVTAVVPEGYELASDQSATVSQEVTENGVNIVTVKVVKKAEEKAATSETTTTASTETATAKSTEDAATTTATVSEAVKTPATVEEAKVVLEQVTSEAEVLANEGNRIVATDTTTDTSALKAVAAATKLVATDATSVLQDTVATLDALNAQINAVRTNVEALALELRKFLGTDFIQVALTTTSTTPEASTTTTTTESLTSAPTTPEASKAQTAASTRTTPAQTATATQEPSQSTATTNTDTVAPTATVSIDTTAEADLAALNAIAEQKAVTDKTAQDFSAALGTLSSRSDRSATLPDTPTITNMDNGNGIQGYWSEYATVLNKEEAAEAARLTPAPQVFPDGYIGDPTTGRMTFLILELSNSMDATQPANDYNAGSFNRRTGLNYYIAFSVNRNSSDGTDTYAYLIDKTTNQIIDSKVLTTNGVGQEFDAILNATYINPKSTGKFKFTMFVTELEMKNHKTGETAITRSLNVAAGVGDGGDMSIVFNAMGSDRGEYTTFTGPVPTFASRQNTLYKVAGTAIRVEEELARYVQTSDLAGDNFTTSGEAVFADYELIEKPTIVSGTLASSYVIGGAEIRYNPSTKAQKGIITTKTDGTSRLITYAINPDHPDFLANYEKYKAMTRAEFVENAATILRLSERIDIIDAFAEQEKAINDDKSTTDDEKEAALSVLRKSTMAQLNTVNDDFLITFVTKPIEPGGLNTENHAITGEAGYSYTSTKYKFQRRVRNSEGRQVVEITDTIGYTLGPFSGEAKASLDPNSETSYMLADSDGNNINDANGQPINFSGARISLPNSNLVNRNDQVYYYAEKGGVKVFYVDEDGNEIKDENLVTDHADTGSDYNLDTTEIKPEKITYKGEVYYYKEIDLTTSNLVPPSANTDSEKRAIVKIDEVTGTIEQDTLKELTYVYEKAGNVNVNYVDTKGNAISSKVIDVENGKPGDTYSTTDQKRDKIETATGEVYYLVPKGTYDVGTVGDDGNLTSDDTPTGAVEAGVTKEVTYVYQEVKGNVVVNYITTDGTVIKQPVEDTPSTSTGTPYDTKDNKPTTITTEDGKTYRIVPVLTKGSETGKVVEGTTSITYVYEEVKGDVVVEYYDTEGNLISGLSDSGEAVDTKEVDTPSTSTGTAYNTDEDHKPNTITTADGTVYYYKEVKDTSASTTGKVVEGTTTVQYVYEKAGNVIVHYITEDGTVIKATVTDEENAKPGKSYDTTDNKPTEIVTEDGSRYVLIPSKTIGTENGTVEGGKTIEITYVYKKVANWIPQIPGVPEGQEPKVPYPFDPTNPDVPVTPTPDTVIPNVPGYTPVDPKTNEPLKPVDPTDPGKGYVPPTPDDSSVDTPVPYVQNGNVVVNYVDENGNVIKAPVQDETNVPAGKSYDTTDNKPTEIVTEDGSRYVLIPSKTVGSETGTVEGGKTTEITYVYKKVANWVPQIPGVPEGQEPKVPYPFDPNNPDVPVTPTPDTVIPYVPGHTPVDPKDNTPLTPVDPEDPNKGYVPPTPSNTGEDTPIPYVQNGNVVVNYVTEDGTVIKAPVQDETNVPAGKSYDTTDNKPVEIVTEDGSRYVLIPSKTVGSETGTVEGGKTIEITYVYKKVANWIPQIPGVPEGQEPKVPYPFDPNNPDVPVTPTPDTVIPYVPGYTPVDPKTNEPLKPVDPTDPGKGYVPPTPDDSSVDTPIPYVQNGNVVVNYVTEDGTVIKTPVNDETDAPAGTSYDTTDNKPTEIVTEDGSRYVLIPSKTIGSETGTVEGGKTTEITYVYKKVANWIPQIPGVPAGEEPKVPYPFDPTNPDVPVTPTPDTVIPNVPGYTPVDPKTNEPLKPFDPTDPGKGYVPPTPDDSSIDTPVPYVQNGNVVVNYVTEDGTVIKTPVNDETDAPAGKSYDTTDNKPVEIVTEDGSRYVLIPSKTIGTENGTVEGGKTIEITYVYKKVANWIPQIPGVPEGQEPKVPYPFDPTNPDVPVTPTPDTVIPNVPGYTPVDPKTNEPLKPVDPTDPGKGYVPPTPDDSGVDTPVPYVQNGNVVVNYVDENGNVLKTPVNDETDAPAGKSYDTTDNKPVEIVTEDGTTYELVRVEGSETGTVVGGKTTEVTYVYRKVETPAKKVVTNHVDEDGNPIAPQEEGTTPNKSIPGYEFTGKTVTDPDGNTTHIYRKVTKVVTNHVDEDGNPIAPQEEGTTPNKSIPGYEFTGKTVTDPDGNTTHIYRKVSKPVAPKPQAPVAPTTAKAGAAQLPNTGEASSSATVLGAGMLIAALALAGKRRRNED
ncbi:TPA: MucBP domain-containing protein [Streptococcus suis]|nr:MucBP domain-containing protein [Streptococcus suis]